MNLSGSKTYIVAASTALYAITGFFLGNVDANTAFQLLSTALGMAAIRHGISTSA